MALLGLLGAPRGTVAYADGPTAEEIEEDYRALRVRYESLLRQDDGFDEARTRFANAAADYQREVDRQQRALANWQEVLDRLKALEGGQQRAHELCRQIAALRPPLVAIRDEAVAIDQEAISVVEVIESAGDAPESLEPLGRAFTSIAAIDSRLGRLEQQRDGLTQTVGRLRAESEAKGASPAELYQKAANAEATLRSTRHNLEVLREEGLKVASELASQLSAVRAVRDELLYDIQTAGSAVHEDAATREAHKRLELAVAKTGRVSLSEASAEPGEPPNPIDASHDDLIAAFALPRFPAEDPSMGSIEQRLERLKPFDPFVECEEAETRFTYYAELANAAVVRVVAAVGAIESAFLSRLGKIGNRVEEHVELIEAYRDDLRVANGKLESLEPLIEERSGRQDAQSREELRRLLAEKAEVEKARDLARAGLDDVSGHLDNDRQELELLEDRKPAVKAASAKAGEIGKGFGVLGGARDADVGD